MTKTYTETFANKQQAQAYYNKIRLGGNLTNKDMGRLAGPEDLWGSAQTIHSEQVVTKMCKKVNKKC